VSRKRKRARIRPRFAAAWLAVLFLLAGGAARYRQIHSRLPGEDVAAPEYVTEDFLSVNPFSRPGTELKKIRGVVIHYVGNPGTTAQANRNYFEGLSAGTDGVYASAHFIVGLDGKVIQCVPLTEESYASNSRNGDTVAVEVCHPDETGQFSDTTYARTVELTAWLCREFRLNPVKDVIRHYDVTGKECPKYYVEHPEAWEQFRTDVKAELERQRAAGKGT